MINEWSGKTVVITGASAGVGAACARAFAALGANLVLAARGSKALKSVAEELEGSTQVLTVTMDVADASECVNLFRKAEFEFGQIHALINNAGCHHRGAVEKLESDELAMMIDVNLRAPIVLSRLIMPYFRTAGHGAIVNVASLAGCTPVKNAAAYSASKFGLRAFSQSLAEELRGSSIHVGVVSPGPIDTGFIMEHIDEVTDLTFSQAMSTAEDVAQAVISAAAGKPEIKLPAISGVLTTMSYLFPWLRRVLTPLLERKGRKAKAYYRARNASRS